MAAIQGTSAMANRVYEHFEPSTHWIREEAVDTLLVYLPGFTKQQLKVQLSPLPHLMISGERPVLDNKWQRFLEEIPTPPVYDTKKITAEFQEGILYIRLPKRITPAEQQGQAKPNAEAPTPQQPMREPPPPQVPSLPLPQPGKSNASVAANSIPDKSQGKESETRLDPQDIPPKTPEKGKSEKENGVREEESGKKEEFEKSSISVDDGARKMEEEVIKQKGSEEKPEAVSGKSVAGAAVGFFRELKKPENRKQLIVTVVSCVILGMLVVHLLTACKCDNQEQ
ncbi:hypothetical protein Ancab_007438 [Ancistrocladus abbreviatus]